MLLAAAALSCTGKAEPAPVPTPTAPSPEPVEPAEPEPTEPIVEPPKPPPVDPGPPAPRYGELPAGHRRIVPVSQTQPVLMQDLYSFAEKRPLLINEWGDGCVIFDIPTGKIVSALPYALEGGCPLIDASGAPASLPPPFEYAFDMQRRLEVEEHALLIYDGEDRLLHRCEDCGWGKWAWSPTDHRFAYLSLDPLRLDIWDAATGKRLERHQLGAGADDALLVWNERGVVGLIHELDEIQETSVVSSVFWPAAGGRVVRQRNIAVDTTLDEVEDRVDPGLRWLVVFDEKEERDGDVTRSRLTMKPLTDLPSKLDWRSLDDQSDEGQHWIDVSGHWRSDATTQWLEPKANVAIVDLDRVEVRHRKSAVVSLAKVALANQQDRLGLVFDEEFELIDAITGKTLLKLPRFAGQAALHPDGHSFAYINPEGELRIVALETGEQVRSWPQPYVDVAWRQDGAALLVGNGHPSAVLDASTGELLATLSKGDWAHERRIPSPERIDPSWRWMRLDDGRIMRTLDGMSLSYGPGWVRLDNGVYDGDVDFPDLLYNVSEDPFEVPYLDSKDLDRWLRRPGLAAAFFAGETIAPASLPIAEAEALAPFH